MKYLKLFQTQEEYDAYKSEGIVRPNVSYIKNTAVVFNGTIPPLYIEAIEDTTITFSKNAIEYSLNNSTWEALPANTATPVIPAGVKAYFRANGLVPTRDNGIGTFSTTGRCNVGGNIMSMAYGEDYASHEGIESNYQFAYLFENAKNLVDATELVLPATTLKRSCYGGMFYKCTGLISAPAEIPSANGFKFSVGERQNGSYSLYTHGMFEGCTSLVNPPRLPATLLAERCYQRMFSGCTGLKTTTELPATQLAPSCYSYMYDGTNILPDCSNIDFSSSSVISSKGLVGLFAGTKVTDDDLERILPKNSNGEYCLPVMQLAQYCYDSMFRDCTNLTTAPVLPATSLWVECYPNMFNGCSNLNYIKAFFKTTPSSDYTSYWVDGVAATGTFVKNAAATWNVTGANGIPSGWTVETAEA